MALTAFVFAFGTGASSSADCGAASIAAARTAAAFAPGCESAFALPEASPAPAVSVVSAPPPTVTLGRARRLRAPTPCDVPAFAQGGPGIPYFVVDQPPRAGHPFRVQWSTKPTAPSDMPAWPAMLFLSFETIAPVPLDAIGAPGCHLQVLPEFVMLPTAGSILTQQGGRVNLDWTPTMSVVGQDFFSQLMVFAPGANGAGILLSPALHVTVGT